MNIRPYAGFWKRAGAFLIDALILMVPTFVLECLIIRLTIRGIQADTDPNRQMFIFFGGILLMGIVYLVLRWIYFAWLESSKYQATVGKMALGIKVVGSKGERISFGRATGRSFAKIGLCFTFYFGYFMAGFTIYRQALHDSICSTFVVSKTYQPGEPLPQYPFDTRFCVISALGSFVLLFLLPGFIYFLILWSVVLALLLPI